MKRLGVLLVLFTVSGCTCGTVPSGHGGIVFDSFGKGTQKDLYGEGLQVLRVGKELIVYDFRVQEMKEDLNVLSNNGLDLKVDASVRYRVEPAKIFELHTQTGPRYADILVGPIVRSEARKVFGRYAPEEIYSTKREQIEKEIYDEVSKALQGKYVIVEAILVRECCCQTPSGRPSPTSWPRSSAARRCASPWTRSARRLIASRSRRRASPSTRASSARGSPRSTSSSRALKSRRSWPPAPTRRSSWWAATGPAVSRWSTSQTRSEG